MENRSMRTKPRTAKVFWNGGSQAVRLPKEFRFERDEVLIRREGESVILEPVPRTDWPDGYWDDLDELRVGITLEDVEPLGGSLLDIDVEPR